MLPPRPGRRSRLLTVASVAVLALSGCSGDADDADDADPGASAPSASATASASASEADGTAEAGDDTEVSGTVPEVDEPVATRTVRQDGNGYRLDVFPLVFTEGSPGVSVNVRLVFEEMSSPSVRSGLLASEEDQGSVRASRASGLRVIDRKGATAYLPARDAEGLPLCSPRVPVDAAVGDQVYVTCVFGGLPEGVESLDLVVPTFGTFRDVPFD